MPFLRVAIKNAGQMRHFFKATITTAIMILLFLSNMDLASAATHAPQQGIVLRVSDGDTIRVRIGHDEEKVRLYEIDAPETKQSGGKEATDYLMQLLLTENVTIYTQDIDQYGRQVAIVVKSDGTIVQDEMLEAGLVWGYNKYCKVSRCKDWKRMEKQAQSKRIGLWTDGTAVPPWEWRKR